MKNWIKNLEGEENSNWEMLVTVQAQNKPGFKKQSSLI